MQDTSVLVLIDPSVGDVWGLRGSKQAVCVDCAGLAWNKRLSLARIPPKEPTHNTSTLRLRRHRPALVEHGRARLHLRAPRVRVGLGRLLLLLLEILDGLSTTRLLGLPFRGG